MSMLLEALKKAALEKKDRADGKAKLSSLAENHHHTVANAKGGDTVAPEPADDESFSPEPELEAEPETKLELEPAATSFELKLEIESESSPDPEPEPKQEADTQQVEDWSDDIDFSELNTQIETQDEKETEVDAVPEVSQEDLIASIVADALAQTEEKTEVSAVETPKSNEHTKAALSQLIQKSKTRERVQNRRLLVIFSSLFVVSVSLGALYFYFLNVDDSVFITAPGTASTLGVIPDMQQEDDTEVSTSVIKEPEITAEENVSAAVSATENTVASNETSASVAVPVVKEVKKTVSPPPAVAKKNRPSENKNPNIIQLDPLPENIQNAYDAYNTGNYKEAENLYREAYALAPQNTDVLLGLAACSIKLNKAEDALLYYKQVLRTNPKERTALAGLLSITSVQADQPEVESRLRNLLNDNPNDAHLHFLMGNLYLSQQNWSGANTQFSRAVSLEARNADYLYNLAISYDQLGQKQEALRYYEEAYNRAQPGPASFSLTDVNQRIRTLSNHNNKSK